MPKNKKTTTKKNLCVLPWIGREVRADGSLSICCICDLNFKESDLKLKRLKQAFQQGRKPKACRACWKLEAADGVSRRQKMNREHKNELKKIEQDPSRDLRKTIFDFKVGNVCNQKCLICGPAASSLWIQEHREVYGTTNYLKTNNISRLTLPTLRGFLGEAQEVHISGGEPFLNIADLEKLLSFSIEAGTAGQQRLILTTNGSVYPERLIRDVFPHFGKVQILMSADGVGPQFDYLRYPGKWDVFFENYLRFKKTGFFSGICLTVNALNAFNIGDYLHFWDEQGENQLLVNYLNSPEVLAVEALPRNIRELIGRRWLEKRFANPALEVLMIELFQYLGLFSGKASKGNLNPLRDSILKHDGYRNVSFALAFKEYNLLLEQAVFQG